VCQLVVSCRLSILVLDFLDCRSILVDLFFRASLVLDDPLCCACSHSTRLHWQISTMLLFNPDLPRSHLPSVPLYVKKLAGNYPSSSYIVYRSQFSAVFFNCFPFMALHAPVCLVQMTTDINLFPLSSNLQTWHANPFFLPIIHKFSDRIWDTGPISCCSCSATCCSCLVLSCVVL
jgi:hypothetical protein